MKEKFTKADLKDGMVVTYRKGDNRIVVNGKLYNYDNCDTKLYYCDTLENWRSSDLTNVFGKNFDIMKVEYDGKVLWERKEKKDIKLTTEERAFLNSILLVSDYKYIARDANSSLYVYKTKPSKSWCNYKFILGDGNYYFKSKNITDKTKGMFEFITWDDDEPYLIEDLLKL